jgi:hypothetical protein
MPLYVLKEPQMSLDPIAEGFLVSHMNGSAIRGKIKEKKQNLAEAKSKLDAEIVTLTGLMDVMQYIATTTEEEAYVFNIMVKRNDALKPLSTYVKSHKETTRMVLDAAEALARLSVTIKTDIAKLKSTQDRDVSVEAQIKYAKGIAMGEVMTIKSFFAVDANQVTVKITKVAPDAPVDFPVIVAFQKELAKLAADITAILAADPETTLEKAQETIAKILAEMTAMRIEKTKELKEYETSSVFTSFVNNTEGRAKVSAMLDQANIWIGKAVTWETASYKSFVDQEKALRAGLDEMFAGREGLSATEQDQLQKEQQAMLSKATSLRVAAQNEVDTQVLAFASKQSELLSLVVALENRMKKLSGIFGPSSQLNVINDFIATTRLSVAGVNGSNLGALTTAQKLIDDATVMVVSAEGISAINKEIRANVHAARKICDARKSEAKHPLALDFVDMKEKLEAFYKVFKEQIPNEANKTSADWLAKFQQKALDDDAIIKRRAEVAVIIGNVEKDLEGLNTIFLTLFANDPVMKPMLDRGYTGALRDELGACRTWNATKTDIAFYDTIVVKLTNLAQQIMAKKADMEKAGKTSLKQANLNALQIFTEFDNTVQGLKDKAGEDGVDGAALREAIRIRDEKLNENNVLLDMKKEFTDEIAAENKALADILKFVEEAKLYIVEIAALRKKENAKSPINYYGNEVDREMERLKLTIDELKSITSVEKMKKAKDAPSGASALSELKFIKNYIQKIWDRGSPTKKNELAEIKGQWDKEIHQFRTVKDQLIEAITAFENEPGIDLGHNGSTELTKVLNIIFDSISSNGFKAPAEVLGNEEASASDRKKARETALAEVRRIRLVMLSDPIFKKCVMNPFKVGGLGSSAQSRLEEIELNVLRGV